MSELPSPEVMAEALKKIIDVTGLDTVTPMSELNVDSLDVLEWLHELELSHELEVSNEVFSSITLDLTIEQIHGVIRDHRAE